MRPPGDNDATARNPVATPGRESQLPQDSPECPVREGVDLKDGKFHTAHLSQRSTAYISRRGAASFCTVLPQVEPQ
jgi:hypothetical protein